MVDQQDGYKQQEPALQALGQGWQCPACGMQLEHSVLVCPQDGTRPLPPPEADPQFRGFEFIGMLGSGGMGVIYKARQIALNKLVAIKMLHPYLLSEEAIRRFQLEGQAVNKLDHPYIIKVHNFGLSQCGPFMIMDYVDGRNLTEILQADGPLSLERALTIFIQACDALAHAHRRGVLHRDLKPSNIMLRKNFRDEEEVCIMDFGIAKLIDDATTNGAMSRITRTGQTVGSPMYMSPEQARSAAVVDLRSDVYSLGCVMYEALTGAAPFHGNNPLETMMMHVNDKPLSLSQSILGVRKFDASIEAVVERLLQKEPDRRYQSMDELKTHLSAIKDGKGLGQFVYKPTAPRRANMAFVAGALTALMAVAIIFVCVSDFANMRDRKPAASQVPSAPIHMPTGKSILRHSVAAGDTTIAPEFVEITDNDLAELESADKVETIVLKYADELTAKGLEHLTKLPRLKEIDVSWCPRITDLSPFRKMINLKSLVLCGDKIGDDELKAVRGLPLENLDLSSTKVKRLDVVRTMPSLRRLEVPRTPITDDGMRNIASLKNLERLELDDTSISESGLRYLAQLPKLNELLLNNCDNLTDVAVRALRDKLPHDCVVQFSHSERPAKTSRSQGEEMLKKGIAVSNNGHFDEAITILDRSLDLLKKQQPLPFASIELCERYLALSEVEVPGKPQERKRALELVDDSIAILERGDAPDDIAGLPDRYFVKALILRDMNKGQEAFNADAESEKLYKKTNAQFYPSQVWQQREAARAEDLRSMGLYHLYSAPSDRPQAKQELEEAYAIWAKYLPERAGSCCQSLGDIYWFDAQDVTDKGEKKRLIAQARTQYLAADKYNQKANDVGADQATTVRTMLAAAESSLGQYQAAEAILKPLIKSLNAPSMRPVQLSVMCQIYENTGRNAEAQKYRKELEKLKH